MVEAEAPPAADGPVDEAPADTAGDASELPLKPPKRLPRPDREHLNAQCDSLAAEIQTRKLRIQEITDIINRKRSGGQTPEEEANRKIFSEHKAKFRNIVVQKKAYWAEKDHLFEERKKLRDETRDIKSKHAGIGSATKIEDQIAELEKRQAHSHMPLNEEKKITAEIQRLKAARTTSAVYEERMKVIAGMDKEIDSIMAKIKQCDREIADNEKCLDAVKQEYDALKAKAQEKNSDIPSLQAERDNCREIMKKVYDKMVELRNEFNATWVVYQDHENAFWAWFRKDKARKMDAERKEKEEHDKERAKEDAYMAGEFFHEEVGACDQLTAYLSKFVASDTASGPAAADAAATAEAATMDGYKVYKRKDEDADSVFGLSAAKKGGKKGKKGGKSDQPAEHKLVHSVDNVRAFAKLNVEIPLSSSKVPATLEVIQARKAYYLDKRAKMVESGAVPKRGSGPKERLPKENGGSANGHAETSGKGAAAANGDINTTEESVLVKTTVEEDGQVAVKFSLENTNFPSLS